jgi:anti-sigma-K factor RskA
MSERFWKYIGVTIAIIAVATLVVAELGRRSKPQTTVAATAPREPSVVSVLRINESETVKTLTVPDAMLSDPLFDTRCLIYTNQDMRQSVIKCLTRPGGPE